MPRLLAQAKSALHPHALGLLAGPDDPNDPYIVTEATALNHDPNQIYAFVRDQIQFEAYRGSVRGAGNTLDKASLLTALLQASGFTTQYEHTTLSNPATLIRTMFPQTPVLLGCVPANTPQDDPGGNGYAVADSHDYNWVKYGPSQIDLDPNLPNGQPGQTLQAPDSNFAVVPQSLRQQVTVKINAEMYSQAGAIFGLGLGTTTVLTSGRQHAFLWLLGRMVDLNSLVTIGPGVWLREAKAVSDLGEIVANGSSSYPARRRSALRSRQTGGGSGF